MPEKKRVLILSASAGSGHKSAANALEKVFGQSPEVAEVLNRDALELTSDTFRNLYADLFLDLVKRAPRFLGWWYDQSDQPWSVNEMRQMLDRLNAQPLVDLIKEFRPDVTVCTHFMPAGIISYLMERGLLQTTLSIVTTDYDFHGLWLSTLFNRYFVAIAQTKAHLTALGLPEERITISGIPVDPAFGAPIDREAVLAKYRLDPGKPILVLSAGAVGGGPAIAVINQIMRLRHDVQSVVICGKNRRLHRQIEQLVTPQAARFRVLGYTTDMASLITIATLFVSKPGGLSAAEAMAAGTPMLIGVPIPGQEERNSDHLLEQGAAIRCNDITVVAHKIDALLDDPERLERMRAQAQRFGRPDAAQLIVDTVLHEPLPVPYAVSEAERERMINIARGRPSDALAVGDEEGDYTLVIAQTGALLGTVSEEEMRFLAAQLELEGPNDHDYYFNQATVELLRERGASPDLLELLEDAIAEHGDADIRWVTRKGDDRSREA